MIHVFIGTKAQYIKMAPLLWRMDESGVDYRLVDSGQHAALAAGFRREMSLREPDLRLGNDRDVDSIQGALCWTVGLLRRLLSGKRLRREVYDGHDGICVVHGDTPTTLLSALMTKRAGLPLAHVEAGLRTHNWFQPFPEEAIRVLVGRMADVLFAPDAKAAAELEAQGVKGRIVSTSANTVAETLRAVAVEANQSGPAVVTMHRVENLYRRRRCETLVATVEKLASSTPVRWYLHGPTERSLAGDSRSRLVEAGVELLPLAGHADFLDSLAAAPFVITDGGSVQEECALLGVPTLLWRDRTDRGDGMGRNVVLSHYDPEVTGAFLADPQRYRRPQRSPAVSPSSEILEVLSALG